MKRFITTLAFVLLTACAQPSNQDGMMQSGSMCEKCSCCQKMMGSGMMNDGKMQCPMMQGDAKDGSQCSCCQKMMEGGMMQDKTAKPVVKKAPAAVSEEEHKQHHPAQ